jgi:hypothetical protein
MRCQEIVLEYLAQGGRGVAGQIMVCPRVLGFEPTLYLREIV